MINAVNNLSRSFGDIKMIPVVDSITRTVLFELPDAKAIMDDVIESPHMSLYEMLLIEGVFNVMNNTEDLKSRHIHTTYKNADDV